MRIPSSVTTLSTRNVAADTAIALIATARAAIVHPIATDHAAIARQTATDHAVIDHPAVAKNAKVQKAEAAIKAVVRAVEAAVVLTMINSSQWNLVAVTGELRVRAAHNRASVDAAPNASSCVMTRRVAIVVAGNVNPATVAETVAGMQTKGQIGLRPVPPREWRLRRLRRQLLA